MSAALVAVVRRAPKKLKKKVADMKDDVFQFRMGQALRLLEVAGERGQSVYDLVLATDLSVQGVLDAIRELQRCGCVIRPRLDYERNLELTFVLRTKLPNIGGAR